MIFVKIVIHWFLQFSALLKKLQKTSRAEKMKNRIRKKSNLHFLLKILCEKRHLERNCFTKTIFFQKKIKLKILQKKLPKQKKGKTESKKQQNSHFLLYT